jgi:primosomal protein N''
LVWNQLKEIQTPPIVTADFVYVRFIGDRSIQEKDFGRIQIDRISEMQMWADSVKNLQEDRRIKQAIIAANNQ